MLFKRIVGLLAMLFGLLGAVACCVGIYAVWSVGVRLHQANDRVFATVDRGLAGARDRVLGVQQRVQESRITADEVGKAVRSWTAKQATERVISRLDVEGQVDRLAQKLHHADLWLESADESLKGAQQLLETARTMGAPVEEDIGDEVLRHLTTVRGSLEQAKETVEGVRDFIAKVEDLPTAEERTARILRLIARLVATISEIDSRLGELASRLSGLQASASRVKTRTSNYIFGATGVGILLGAWMAAGQLTLFLYARKTCRRRHVGTPAPGNPPQGPRQADHRRMLG